MYTNEELCQLAQNGNAEARQALLDDNMGFYIHVANSLWEQNPIGYNALGIEAEDLLQEGLLKLDSGINTFKPNRGADFLTYIRSVLHNAMVDYVRLELRSNSLHSDLRLEDDKNEYLQKQEASASVTPEAALILEEKRQALAGAWQALPQRHKAYMRYRFGLLEGDKVQTTNHTAKHFFLTPRLARQIEREALSFLRREYAARPFPGDARDTLHLEPEQNMDEEGMIDTFLESANDYDDPSPENLPLEAALDPYEKLELEETDIPAFD